MKKLLGAAESALLILVIEEIFHVIFDWLNAKLYVKIKELFEMKG